MTRLAIISIIGLTALAKASDTSIEVTLEDAPVETQARQKLPPAVLQKLHLFTQAWSIVEAIHKHEASINASAWDDDHGHPNVVIRDVFDRKRQNQIVRW